MPRPIKISPPEVDPNVVAFRGTNDPQKELEEDLHYFERLHAFNQLCSGDEADSEQDPIPIDLRRLAMQVIPQFLKSPSENNGFPLAAIERKRHLNNFSAPIPQLEDDASSLPDDQSTCQFCRLNSPLEDAWLPIPDESLLNDESFYGSRSWLEDADPPPSLNTSSSGSSSWLEDAGPPPTMNTSSYSSSSCGSSSWLEDADLRPLVNARFYSESSSSVGDASQAILDEHSDSSSSSEVDWLPILDMLSSRRPMRSTENLSPFSGQNYPPPPQANLSFRNDTGEQGNPLEHLELPSPALEAIDWREVNHARDRARDRARETERLRKQLHLAFPYLK